jgi:ribonuclease-3
LPAHGLDALAVRLGIPVGDPVIVLAPALIHRSWCAENPGHEPNERLEFLGDAVLGLVVTDHVYRAYPRLSEGELTDVRKAVVNAVTLAEVAGELDLGAHLVLGKGEELSGGREKPSILADALEAVLGAVYLHAGFDAARDVVLRLLGDRIVTAEQLGPSGQDHKSRLQELVAQRLAAIPRYETQADGPDHARSFRVTVFIDGVERGVGRGRSKKQAEQAAARAACAALLAELEPGDEVTVKVTVPDA